MISVVIPVYNTENYLEECLNSVVEQTYKNLDIILIDDGSTDKSGEICDIYAKKDNRIRVYHIENSGQSVARNSGIKIANGKFISFIDSDDWIDKEFYEKMISHLEKYDADIAVCGRKLIYPNKSIIKFVDTAPKIFNKKKALEELMLARSFDSSTCDKLYKMDLFKNVRYPCDKTSEDHAVVYKLILNSSKIVHIGDALYYYRKGIAGSVSERIEPKSYDLIEIKEQVVNEIVYNYPELEKIAQTYLNSSIIGLKSRIEMSSKEVQESTDITGFIEKVDNLFKSKILQILLDKNISIKQKFTTITLLIHLYPFLRKIRGY